MSKRYPGNFITGNPVALSQTSNNGIWDVTDVSAAVAAGTWQEPDGIYEIPKSLRFRQSASAYLEKTFSSAGNRRTWTYSFWFKRGNQSEGLWRFLYVGNGSNNETGIYLTGDRIQFEYYVAPTNYYVRTSRLLRDPSAWYHIVVVYDATNSMANDRMRIYVNGTRESDLNANVQPTQNFEMRVNEAASHLIGARTGGQNYFDGYLTEINHIDGQALDPSYFGYFDPITNIWQPKRYTGTYGTNGFYLPFNVDTTLSADFLVVAGGGGGGSNRGGGGGAGGFRTSAGTSGRNSAAETPLTLATGVAYTVTVGAGGGSYTNGNNSVLGTITSLGGGRGGGASNGPPSSGGAGGGGAGDDGVGEPGTAAQGFDGGTGEDNGGSGRGGGGGGGAGQVGATAVNGTFTAGNGGNGLASTISGSSVTYSAGGGGGYLNNGTAGTAGTGGSGGLGGNGASGSSGGTGGSASSNTGSGGGGAAAVASGGSGGSGIVVIKIPSSRTAIFSSGVTFTGGTASGGFRIYTVTATSTTSETVTFA